jgi:hypothetical protein
MGEVLFNLLLKDALEDQGLQTKGGITERLVRLNFHCCWNEFFMEIKAEASIPHGIKPWWWYFGFPIWCAIMAFDGHRGEYFFQRWKLVGALGQKSVGE